ncbi:uncharacterized protein [Littorina saxatilis]|uniref:uncharacterized protein n=1 Tax=Littorina saxatilis TaxID=31220 RepID=UPI0038B5AA90
MAAFPVITPSLGLAVTLAVLSMCVVTILPSQADTRSKGDVKTMEVSKEIKYCPFFNNRAPEVQRNLKNCTWFKESSCCRQEEIDATFGRVKPLRGASPECQRYTNYLMCYICSPDQHRFYLMESLTVCEEFCQAWYDACKTAILKGSVIRSLYADGEAFCRSRRFKVDTVKNGKCFFFDARQDKNGAARETRCKVGHLVLLALFSVFVIDLRGIF